MRDRAGLLVALVVIAIAAAGAAPWRNLPPCLSGKWTGITVTDEVGNLLGPEDPADWGCAESGAASSPADVPVPPPSGVCLLPAAPNPTSGATVLRFTLPAASPVSLVVYGKKGNGPHGAFPVRTLVDGERAAGVHSVMWDGNDDLGARVRPAIYRVALVVGEKCVCGDVEVR